jgi:hypothetical protein
MITAKRTVMWVGSFTHKEHKQPSWIESWSTTPARQTGTMCQLIALQHEVDNNSAVLRSVSQD